MTFNYQSYDRWEDKQRARQSEPPKRRGRPPKVAAPATAPAVEPLPPDARTLFTRLILKLGTDASRELLAGLPEQILTEVL